MEDPKYAEAILIESKAKRGVRHWNMPRNLARSTVEFVQVSVGRNPEPAFSIFAAIYYEIAA